MTLTQQENAERMRLYSQGLTDSEIARILGISYSSARGWRRRRNLPMLYEPQETKGVPMEVALTPDECREMRRFLNIMIVLKDEYPTRRMDVMRFIQEYRKGGFAYENQ